MRPLHQPPRPASRAAPSRATSTPAVVLLVLWAVGLCALIGQRVRAAVQAVAWIDPGALRLGDPGPGFDPRWEALFDATTAAFPPLRADDQRGLAELACAIGELPFVSAVGTPRVLAPATLTLELVLRVPAACVPVGERFQPVAADGTLLPGLWPLPPEVRGVPLPVLGPLADGEHLFPLARAGDYLAEERHLAALDVALSLAQALDAAGRARLGPILIDATVVDLEFPDEPCIRIELACGREIRFGRAPASDGPGELPAEQKWSAVSQALALLEGDDPPHDWDRLDVRWDHPELRLVDAPLVADARPTPGSERLGARAEPRSASDRLAEARATLDAERPERPGHARSGARVR